METKFIFTVSLLLFYFNTSLAQAKQDPYRHVSIGITPLNFIEPRTSTLESVAELRWNQHWAVEVKYGLKFTAIHPNRKVGIGDYYELKIGGKYYGEKWLRRRSFNPYYGLEYFYLNRRYDKVNGNFESGGNRFTYESSKVKCQVNAARLMSGISFLDSDKAWTIEYYGGIGIRWISVDYYDIVNAQLSNNLFEERDWAFWPRVDREEGTKAKFDLAYGIKIAYKIIHW